VVASILLFGLPSIFLAGVTPIAVRLRTRELETVGRTAPRSPATRETTST
jgi:hypothetical protein